MTQVESMKLTAMLASLYDVPAWTAERLEIFAAAIADLGYPDARTAVQTWMATRRERPQPSDIRALVSERAIDAPGVEEAWGLVAEAIRQCCYSPPADLPPLCIEAMRRTGRAWRDLPMLPYDQYPWLQRDFQRAYRELVEQRTARHAAGCAAIDHATAVEMLGDATAKPIENLPLRRGRR